jgi:hypothetical protein
VVHELILEGGAQSIALAAGTSVPLLVRAYEILPSGERHLVEDPAVSMESDPPGVVDLSEFRLLCGICQEV